MNKSCWSPTGSREGFLTFRLDKKGTGSKQRDTTQEVVVNKVLEPPLKFNSPPNGPRLYIRDYSLIHFIPFGETPPVKMSFKVQRETD